MRASASLGMAVAAALAAPMAMAQTTATDSIRQVKGKQELANVVVDTAPGTVSAVGLLGIGGDKVVTVDNPRDLTLAIKPMQGGTALGIAFTPARSAIAPMSVKTYSESPWARLAAGMTLGWAQHTTTVNDKAYRQRAMSVETSVYLQPERDDPAVRYWKALEQADPANAEDPCVLIPPEQPGHSPAAAPGQPVGPDAPVIAPRVTAGAAVPAPATVPLPGDAAKTTQLAERAQACRMKALKGIRWNSSRLWASYVDARYRPVTGSGPERRLGRTLVLGASWGFGDASAPRASAVTLAGQRIWDEPTLATLDDASPTRRNSWLLTLRGAHGSESQRVLVEASHLSASDSTTSTRTYKRAIGVDLKLGTGTWLILRTGKQRRIDGHGDESGSSVSLSLSPVDLLKF